MDPVLRAAVIYALLMLLIRLSGKRSLAQVTTFDFVLLLVIGESAQQALLGEDFSLTQAALVVMTLLVLERLSDVMAWRWPRFRRWSQGQPTLLVANGVPVQDALDHNHLTIDDVLTAARERLGLHDMGQIGWAVLEVSGGITVIPRQSASQTEPADPAPQPI